MSVRAPVGPINFTPIKICIGRGLAAIRPGKAIDREFLFYALLAKQADICGSEGAVFSSISKRQVEEIPIGIPPIAEQQRIVAILDEAFAGLETMRAHAAKNLQNARELFDSHLDFVFDQNLEAWSKATLADVSNQKRGITYGVIKLGEEVPDGTPCLRTSNIKRLAAELNGLKRISKKIADEYTRTVLRGGEVLVNVRGTLGGVYVAPQSMAGWNVSREIAVVPILPDIVLPAFAAYAIAARPSQSWLAGVRKGAAYVGINLEDLRLLTIPVPSRSEQAKVVERLDDLSSQVQRIETIYRAKLAALDELKQSILQKAFSGELTASLEIAA